MKKIKAIIFDSDGMLTHGPRFSEQYSKEFNIDIETMLPFFKGPFKSCLVGKADLKEELKRVLFGWKWNGTVDELVKYWFSVGDKLDKDAFDSVAKLKEQGLVCCLATNQEKYRTEYLISKFSYNSLFDLTISSAHIGYPKTSSEGLGETLKLLSKVNICKEEILYWDDDDDNVSDLHRLGIDAQKYISFQKFQEKMLEYGYRI